MPRILSILLAIAAALPGQDPAPPDPITVRVLSRGDDLPRPGVTLFYLDPRSVRQTPADGWVHTTDERLLERRAARRAYTDPTGVARLAAEPGNLRVFAGPPYLGAQLEDDAAGFFLRVDQQELFTVTALDAAGERLADFALALYAGNRDEAVALTDAKGLALLGMPKDFSARLTVAPAGWIGPRESFPTVATVLRRARAELQVPAFGSVRVRPVRRGVPGTATTGVCQVTEPTQRAMHWHGQGPFQGFEVTPVALGQTLRGRAEFDGLGQLFLEKGPTAPGECVTIDIEVEPARAQLEARLLMATAGTVQAIAPGTWVSLTVHSDAGRYPYRLQVATDGRLVTTEFHGLHGKRLRRVDVDVEVSAHRDRAGVQHPAQAWWATLRCDAELTPTTLALGELTLRPHATLLTGRLVDAAGKPLARAHLDIVVADGSAQRTTSTDSRGHFTCIGPWPRDDDGKPLPVTLTFTADGVKQTSPQYVPGSEVTFTVRRPRQLNDNEGALTAHIVDLPAANVRDVQFELLPQAEEARFGRPPFEQRGEATTTDVEWRNLPSGRYTLRATAPLGKSELLRIADFEVTAEGCADARLQEIRVADGLQTFALQVVDAAGVAIAGATLEMHTPLQPRPTVPQGQPAPRFEPPLNYARRTDGTGRARVTVRRGAEFVTLVQAEGHRPLDPGALVDGAVLRLEPAGRVAVQVMGLPAELPRTSLLVQLSHVERSRFELRTEAMLPNGDLAMLPLPARGRYEVELWLTDERPDGSRRRLLARRTTGIELGDAPTTPIEFPLDAEAVARVRQALAVGK